ncbi:MAG: helix-turn-helix transcriptional regulator [Labilithrix sp.]|nr:helix-turn-helix transcriptional regulator [Labilithrix sp.]
MLALAEKGYALATIADIVAKARVSKRTFYEHFADKEACLLATYKDATTRMQAAMAHAFELHAGAAWPAQVDAVIDAYVTALESTPALTRACLVEMAAAGPRALRMRREVHEAFATQLRAFVDHARKRHPEVGAISAPLATAIVGGVDELLLAQVERGPQHRLADLRETASHLLRAVLTYRRPSAKPQRSR